MTAAGDAATPCKISLVFPVYNESGRLAQTFEQVAAWLAAPPRTPAEVILADDGSEDGTLALLEEFARQRPGSVQVLRLPHRGKAATVRDGVLAARGELVLFSDADLSVPLDDAALLIAAIEDGADVAIGSRELPGATREAEPAYRHLMGRAFNQVVQVLLVPGIQDTQCGFKMFRRAAGRGIFESLRCHAVGTRPVRGPMVTAFDVELLFLARQRGLRIDEVPVHWTHGPGSKVRPVLDSLRMLRDVLHVRWAALRGAYRDGSTNGPRHG